MKELIKLVQEWANDKGLNKPEQAQNQLLKLIEEYGETCGAILKRPKHGDKALIDGFGDMLVVTIIFCLMTNKEYKPNGSFYNGGSAIIRHIHCSIDNLFASVNAEGKSAQNTVSDFIAKLYHWIDSLGFTPEQCLQAAYNEIKGRTGTLVNGTFIKDEALQVPQHKKPNPVDYGWCDNTGFDSEPSFWTIEEGEEEYNKALKLWELSRQSK